MKSSSFVSESISYLPLCQQKFKDVLEFSANEQFASVSATTDVLTKVLPQLEDD
jgi:hypothetical protein